MAVESHFTVAALQEVLHPAQMLLKCQMAEIVSSYCRVRLS